MLTALLFALFVPWDVFRIRFLLPGYRRILERILDVLSLEDLHREALANRINRLAMEEVRATRRIEQTHRRTQEIISAKNRHAAQQTVKETLREEHEALVAEHTFCTRFESQRRHFRS